MAPRRPGASRVRTAAWRGARSAPRGGAPWRRGSLAPPPARRIVGRPGKIC